MLSHLYRFHGHGSLRFTHRRGQKIRSRFIGVTITKNPKRVHSRYAVIISKKIYKQAVRRNKLRRRILKL